MEAEVRLAEYDQPRSPAGHRSNSGKPRWSS
jgi:hypothetical protein